jgi:hypothetical protein
MSGRGALLGIVAALVLAPPAVAGGWLPHPADASWTYAWSDSVYAATPTTEKVTVKESKGSAFTLAWTTKDQGNPDGAVASAGEVTFQDSNVGLVNTDWSSTPAPPGFPILCASASQCPNSLASTLYNVIWGARSPVLAEPVVKGLVWSSSGGAQGDVSSTSSYLGTEQLSVPAFPGPVTAAKVQTQITQAGALGDPYGSGLRTVWWVYGVGPVKLEFQHAGGAGAAVTTAVLESTNQSPAEPPTDELYFPLEKGQAFSYRWTNHKHLAKPEVERFTVDAVVNGSARFSVKSVSGPIKLVGSYGFSSRLDGVINLWGTTQSQTLASFPPLGPASAPKTKRRHLLTPFDFMTFGFNPILDAYPKPGDSWAATVPSRDFSTYGVSGNTTVLGVRSVTVPAGSFQALAVRSTLRQPGFPYGSGTRTCYFAAGKGLVKLVFAHRDGSVSTIELLK